MTKVTKAAYELIPADPDPTKDIGGVFGIEGGN